MLSSKTLTIQSHLISRVLIFLALGLMLRSASAEQLQDYRFPLTDHLTAALATLSEEHGSIRDALCELGIPFAQGAMATLDRGAHALEVTTRRNDALLINTQIRKYSNATAAEILNDLALHPTPPSILPFTAPKSFAISATGKGAEGSTGGSCEIPGRPYQIRYSHGGMHASNKKVKLSALPSIDSLIFYQETRVGDVDAQIEVYRIAGSDDRVHLSCRVPEQLTTFTVQLDHQSMIPLALKDLDQFRFRELRPQENQ